MAPVEERQKEFERWMNAVNPRFGNISPREFFQSNEIEVELRSTRSDHTILRRGSPYNHNHEIPLPPTMTPPETEPPPPTAGTDQRRRRRHLHRRRPRRRPRLGLDPQGAVDAARLRARRARRRPAPARTVGHRGLRGRRGGARNDRGDQRRARAPRRPHRPGDHRRLPRRPRAAPHPRPADLRPLLGQAAAAGRPRPAPGAERARRRRTARCCGPSSRRSCAPSGNGCSSEGIESVAVCLLHSYAHPGHEQAVGGLPRPRAARGSRSRSPTRCFPSARSTSAPPPPSSTPTCARS